MPSEPVPYNYTPPTQGIPATEHLDSNGKFATVNPAGTQFIVQNGAVMQIDVGTEVPPSVQKIRAAATPTPTPSPTP